MPQQLRWGGSTITRPGVYTRIDLGNLTNLGVGPIGTVVMIGEATAGAPTTPVAFTSAKRMAEYFQGGVLADAAQLLFSPGRGFKGAKTVIAIKTNQSTRASAGLAGAASDSITVKDRIYGTFGAFTAVTVAVASGAATVTTERVSKPLIGSVVSPALGGTEWFTVQRTNAGSVTSARITIDRSAGTLLLEKNAGSWATEFTITLSATKTVAQVIAEIGTKAAWSASIVTPARGAAPSNELDDQVASANPATAIPVDGMIYDVITWINANNPHVTAERGADDTQLVSQAKEYLQGGALGTTDATSTGDIVDALEEAAKLGTRHVVSGYETTVDATGIDTVNGYFATHATAMNADDSRGERHVWLGRSSTTKSSMLTAARSLNNEFVHLGVQRVKRAKADGTVDYLGAWAPGAIAAAIMAGQPVATPITAKHIEAADVDQGSSADWTPTEDYVDLITSGILALEPDPGNGFRYLKGITTYTSEDNDARTLIEVVDARIQLKQSLRLGLEPLFLGTKGLGAITARAIQRRAIEIMSDLADTQNPDVILVPGTDANGTEIPAFRNVSVTVSGDAYVLDAEVTFVTGVNFILNQIVGTLPVATAA